MIINDLLKNAAEELRVSFLESLEKQFSKDESSTKINSRTGALLDSFKEQTKVKIENGEIILDIQSDLPYAHIQDVGGFIPSKPITVLRKNNSFQTYKVAQFFWYKYSETGIAKWKYMALSAHKKGGVDIKPKNYINKALLDVEKKMESWYNKLILSVDELFN